MLKQNNYFPAESAGASIPYQEETKGNDKHSNINLVMINATVKVSNRFNSSDTNILLLTFSEQSFYVKLVLDCCSCTAKSEN